MDSPLSVPSVVDGGGLLVLGGSAYFGRIKRICCTEKGACTEHLIACITQLFRRELASCYKRETFSQLYCAIGRSDLERYAGNAVSVNANTYYDVGHHSVDSWPCEPYISGQYGAPSGTYSSSRYPLFCWMR